MGGFYTFGGIPGGYHRKRRSSALDGWARVVAMVAGLALLCPIILDAGTWYALSKQAWPQKSVVKATKGTVIRYAFSGVPNVLTLDADIYYPWPVGSEVSIVPAGSQCRDIM